MEKKQNRIFASFTGAGPTALRELSLGLLESQKSTWAQLREGHTRLDACLERRMAVDGLAVLLQCNPQRIVSTAADTNPAAISKRACFLCPQNLPPEQRIILYHHRFLVLCNPFPIFAAHFTVAHVEHLPQALRGSWPSLLQLARDFGHDFAVLYNGPLCGASAPDHLHFQAVPLAAIPVLNAGTGDRTKVQEQGGVAVCKARGGLGPALMAESGNMPALIAWAKRTLTAARRLLSQPGEPLVNLFCLYREQKWQIFMFIRRQHRPSAYYRTGDEQVLISPGAVDMGGLIILPRKQDFHRLTTALIQEIINEICLPETLLDEIVAAAGRSHKTRAAMTPSRNFLC